MNNLNLKFAAQKLTKEQMKNVSGGMKFQCYAVNSDGSNGSKVGMLADNCCQAQALADATAYSNEYTDSYPNGINCPCDEIC